MQLCDKYMSALVEKYLRQIHDLSTLVSGKILARKIKFVQHQPTPLTTCLQKDPVVWKFFFLVSKIMGRIVTEHQNTD